MDFRPLIEEQAVEGAAYIKDGQAQKEWTRPGSNAPLRSSVARLLQAASALEGALASESREHYLLVERGLLMAVRIPGEKRAFVALFLRDPHLAGTMRRKILALGAKEEGDS